MIEEHGKTELDYKKTDDTIISPVIDIIVDAIREKKHKSNGKIKIEGRMSLAEQKPFILSQTIRENILFGEELDNDRYNSVVGACQLGRDFEIIDGGDMAQLGEKGITLSGGQKARVSLARAVYSSRDIVLMDDPLSAFDAHVKREVFDQVCCDLLRKKTRIIVTHAVDFLDKVDRIIVMRKGKIMLNGTYSELLDHEYFKKMMKTVGKQDKINEEECSSQADSEETSATKDTKDHMSKKEKKMLKRESDDDVNITLNTYYEFFSYVKSGIPFMILCMMISVAGTTVIMRVDYLFISWVKNFVKDGSKDYETLYWVVYMIFGKLLIDSFSYLIEIVQNYMLFMGLFKDMLN